jgi:hypothetical protein
MQHLEDHAEAKMKPATHGATIGSTTPRKYPLTTPIAPSTKLAFASSIGATSALTGQTNKTFLTQELDTPGLAASSHSSGMKQQHYGNK